MKDTFAELGLGPELLAELTKLGYEEPTPIQKASAPPLIEGRDLLGQAATGTGKTAAFALPLLQRLADTDAVPYKPLLLVLVPTRELAVQVSEAFHRYGRGLGISVAPIYGGQEMHRQIVALKRGAHVVIATPGRVLDHMRRGTIELDGLRSVVLDEADEMLDMGFAEDLDAILGALPAERQTVLFSATMPKRIDSLARRHLSNPTTIRIEAPVVAKGDAPKVRQLAFMVPRSHKPAALGRILDVEAPAAAIVFCRTRVEVDQLTETLNGRGYRAEALHGGMNQEGRDRVMARVRSGNADLLIATDVAARGLDIDLLTHVVNYDVPSAPESYVHRIGRVGRAGREGVAITLAEPREHRLLENIQRVTGDKIAIEKVPTISDLRNRRMELTLGTLRETLLDDDLDRYRTIVESLTDEFDLFEVALAAVKLTHEATTGAEDEVEIPEVEVRRPKDRKNDRGERGDRDRGERGDRDKKGKKNKDRSIGVDSTRLYFPIGRSAQVRPGDLVGAITGETGLAGKQIGSIEIADKFSLVEVPEKSADDIIRAMKKTTIKGRKVVPRRERFQRFER